MKTSITQQGEEFLNYIVSTKCRGEIISGSYSFEYKMYLVNQLKEFMILKFENSIQDWQLCDYLDIFKSFVNNCR